MCLECKGTSSESEVLVLTMASGEVKFNYSEDKIATAHCIAYIASDGTADDATKSCAKYPTEGTNKNICLKCKDGLSMVKVAASLAFDLTAANVTSSYCVTSDTTGSTDGTAITA